MLLDGCGLAIVHKLASGWLMLDEDVGKAWQSIHTEKKWPTRPVFFLTVCKHSAQSRSRTLR